MPEANSSPPARHFETVCAQGAESALPAATPPLAPALFPASVFLTPNLDVAVRALARQDGLYAYSRVANPTVAAFEAAMARLESAETAVATASGMAAITAVFLAYLKPGDTLATPPALYGTTAEVIASTLLPLGIRHVEFEEAPDPSARLIFAESISNPLLSVADVPALAAAAKASGALLAVDATFATPFHSQPLTLGADLVIHSATKFLGGHSDLIAGVVAGSEATLHPVRGLATNLGLTLGPFEAWLAQRGLRTLHLRQERAAANAARVADFLAGQPGVAAVHYPGNPDHPDHSVATRIMAGGFGAMVSFDLGADRDRVERFLAALTLVKFAPSLGDVTTTISHPLSTSHRHMPADARLRVGIGEGLLRLSVGVEAAADIIADLEVALRQP